ncbi:hypothetical protein DSCOOX_08960 [Desulfosarcina ovata subsp. ovata]|uniref:Right handed beta helix domain-containing protein n=2 Tax=Desulfosarcina ovata TaxID=83564 RepID=A0A5K8A5I5_9BACT|nr:hypothetical protein DSCOOX_08960 [Desulfosarcina ovata subsp. ovata]
MRKITDSRLTAYRSYGMVLFVLFLASWTTAWGETYYVSSMGNDEADGSIDQPLKTLVAAVAKIQPGDRMLIHEGIYAEMLDVTRSGTADQPITVEPVAGATVRIDATGLRHGVIIYDADYIIVRGLTIENSLRSGIHIHDHQNGGYGANFNCIEGNTIRRCGTEGFNGIYVGGHSNQVFSNQVIGNAFKTDESANIGHGIYVLGNDNQVGGNIVRANAGVGIRLEGERNRFEDNVIEDNLDFGITIWVDAPMKGEDLVIRNNLLRDNQRGGISVYGQGDGEKPRNVLLSGNIIVNQNGEYGIRVMEGCCQVRVMENTFQGAFSKAVLYVDEASLVGYEEHDSHIESTGGFYFKNKTYDSYTAYKQAYLVDPVNLRKAP